MRKYIQGESMVSINGHPVPPPIFVVDTLEEQPTSEPMTREELAHSNKLGLGEVAIREDELQLLKSQLVAKDKEIEELKHENNQLRLGMDTTTEERDRLHSLVSEQASALEWAKESLDRARSNK